MAAIETGVDMLLKAGMNGIRRKSVKMSEYFLNLFNDQLKGLGYTFSSPLNSGQRGSHISISHHEAYRITKALMDKRIDGYKIVTDYRSPDNIRFGLAPLYNNFEEIYYLFQKLRMIAQKKLYLNYDNEKNTVT